MAKRPIFRQEALDRLSSPERLETLMTVIQPRHRIMLGVLLGLMIFSIAWGIFGRVPEYATGRGVLVHPRQVVPLESVAGGRVEEIRVEVGDAVERDAVIAVLAQPELTTSLSLARDRLELLQGHTGRSGELRSGRNKVEATAITRKKDALETRIKTEKLAAKKRLRAELAFVARQRTMLEERMTAVVEQGKALEQRWKNYESLEVGEITFDRKIAAEMAHKNNLAEAASLESDLHALAMRKLEAERAFELANLAITDDQTSFEQLEIEESLREQRVLEESFSDESAVERLQDEITSLETRLDQARYVRSSHDGRIQGLSIAVGEVLHASRQIGTIRTGDPGKAMVSLAFLDVGSGKKVQPGMDVFTVPDSAQREKDGMMRGRVERVSAYPISVEDAVSLVGNREIAASLASEGRLIEVQAALELDDTSSGYAWTSRTGPDLEFSPGTTTQVFVVLERRRPISYVLPWLRGLSGTD